MKKMYTIALAFAVITSGSFAQSGAESIPVKQEEKRIFTQEETTLVKKTSKKEKDLQLEIWSDDFSDATTWVLDHDETVCTLDWEIGVGLENQGNYPTAPITSTTADNGYAMLDSDYYGSVNPGDDEDAWMTTADPIDLTDYPYVVVEFESLFRSYYTESLYIVISTNNTDWPDLFVDYDADSNPNVFEVFADVPGNESTDNPETLALNISDVAGGESEVWIRFNWTGSYNYTWFVDDVKVLELPDNDMRVEYGVISHNGTGDEYARIPTSMLNDEMSFAALTTNIGRLDQTDVVIDVTVTDSDANTVLSVSSDVEATVAPNAEFEYETSESFTLNLGLHTTEFLVTSAEEVDGDNFDNNLESRNFEITDNIYSLDGIGVHDVAQLNSFGTASFADNPDGIMMMVYYDINQEEAELYGVEFELSSTTVPGGTVYVYLLDTADVFVDDVGNPLAESEEYTITQEDVDAGTVQVYFIDPFTTPEANAYYAAVEMNSDDNQYDIRILDDVTVPQPGGSSMIYLTDDDAVYSNTNAGAVRLITMEPNAINEIEKTAILGQNVPNPARDRTTVSFELLSNLDVTVRLTDMLGKVVIEEKLGNLTPGNHNYTFELNGLKAGTYHYSIVTDNGSLSKSMQIIK